VSASTIDSNTAEGGGGVGAVSNGGRATITSSTISSNEATNSGGGAGGVLNGCVFSCPDPQLVIVNSTITSNRAFDGSGGVFTSGGTVSITDSTISGNSGPAGAGVTSEFSATVTVKSSVISNPASSGKALPNCAGTITDAGFNISSDASCGFTGTSRASTDPQLGPLQDNGGPTRTMLPLAGSPVLDVIPAVSCTDQAVTPAPVTTDQRGQSRPKGGGCEIGAVEVPAITVTPDAKSVAYNAAAPAYTFTLSPLTPSTNYTAPTCSAPGYTVGAATGSTFPISCSGGKADGYSFVQTAAASLTVTAVAPSVARSVSVSPRNRSVVVSWVAPSSTGGAAITGYMVKASPKVGTVFKTCSWALTTPAKPLTCTVPGLTNGKAYTLTVKATNAVSKSSTTAKSVAVIAGSPTVARNLAITFPLAKNAKVAWTAPQFTGSGAVTGYRLRWCKAGGTCAAWVSLPATARTATATARVKNTNYRVEIQAKNGSGYGPVAIKAFKQSK